MKNHKHSMSQSERAFWREAFLAWMPDTPAWLSRETTEEAAKRADFADAAVAEYRKRVTWRTP